MSTETNATEIYWRTGKGSHLHSSNSCANILRSVFTGDPTIATGSDLNMPYCSKCVVEAEKLNLIQPVKEEIVYCTGVGQSWPNPKRVYNVCPDCGKTLKTKPGRIVKHKS